MAEEASSRLSRRGVIWVINCSIEQISAGGGVVAASRGGRGSRTFPVSLYVFSATRSKGNHNERTSSCGTYPTHGCPGHLLNFTFT